MTPGMRDRRFSGIRTNGSFRKEDDVKRKQTYKYMIKGKQIKKITSLCPPPSPITKIRTKIKKKNAK